MDAWCWLALVAGHLEEILFLLGLLATLTGALVYVLRNPGTHFGIAQQYEEDGRVTAALKHYGPAAKYGAGRIEGRVSQTRIGELAARELLMSQGPSGSEG